MAEKPRKMGFWEIGKKSKRPLLGTLQALFEQAQIEAFERGVKTSVALVINIRPPDKDDNKWGKISFTTSLNVPKEKSREFTTELVDGIAIDCGDSQSEILQYSLEFPGLSHDNVQPFPKRDDGTN
jgi:hypothetical protein